jgi:hypothetical protein
MMQTFTQFIEAKEKLVDFGLDKLSKPRKPMNPFAVINPAKPAGMHVAVNMVKPKRPDSGIVGK